VLPSGRTEELAGHVAQLRLSGCATLSEEGDLAGYIAASATNPSPVQPASAIIAIKATICLVPALAALIAMLIFIKYPLTDRVFQEIRDETEARKLAAIKAHHERPEDFITPDRKV
jgi:hypothetical protein